MAFDGITIACLAAELRDCLLGGRIHKIAQPETDELILTCRGNQGTKKLLLSASASLPYLYFTEQNKTNPLTAPSFCMLLRKHIGSARIINITQPGLERVLFMDLEHLNEMGDLCQKRLIVEIMGKHSNIIFCEMNGKILDSIKHVSSNMSSVREVLPGREYFIPKTQDKLDPLEISQEIFLSQVCTRPMEIGKALYGACTGISPVMANEICHRASLDSAAIAQSLTENEKLHLCHVFLRLMEQIKNEEFSPHMVYKGDEPAEYAAFPMTQYGEGYIQESFPSMSRLLETWYASKSVITRIRQKSADLRKIVQTALDRNRKKYQLQQKQLKDTGKKDQYKVYGELINAYGYGLEEGCKSFRALNYYTNEEITIPLNPDYSPAENAKRYFTRYNKLKRTEEALNQQIQETSAEIQHLESIQTALDIALQENDLAQIKEELMDYGYIRRKYGKKQKIKGKSKPFHYISSDGFHMYVGKNNFQNEELTFKVASGNDWWFHAKQMPGSHVIVKSNNQELPDRTFEEAGQLAAYYSSGRGAPKVEIDYIQKKHVKKTPGGKPGFVIYHTNYSLVAAPDISNIKEE